MKPVLVLAAVLACASARVLIPGGYAPQSVAANQGSVALGGVGSTVVATGTANAAGLRVKREPYGYGYPGYGYGNYAPQNIAANQNSNAIGGPGSTVVATGTANAAGQRWKRSSQYYGYYPGYGYGGYRPQAVTANQASNAVGGDGSTVVASGTSNAGASRVKREPYGAYLLTYDPYFSYGYGLGGYGLGYGYGWD